MRRTTRWALVLLLGLGGCRRRPPGPPAAPPNATPPANISIQDAVSDGNVEQVRRNIAGGANVNATTATGTPILMQAAGGHFPQDLDICRMLIDAGATVRVTYAAVTRPCTTQQMEVEPLSPANVHFHGYEVEGVRASPERCPECGTARA
jgi:hypothetical protein